MKLPCNAYLLAGSTFTGAAFGLATRSPIVRHSSRHAALGFGHFLESLLVAHVRQLRVV